MAASFASSGNVKLSTASLMYGVVMIAGARTEARASVRGINWRCARLASTAGGDHPQACPARPSRLKSCLATGGMWLYANVYLSHQSLSKGQPSWDTTYSPSSATIVQVCIQ